MAKSVTVDEMLIQLQKKIIKWWEVPTGDRSEGTRIRTEAKAELSKLVDEIIGEDEEIPIDVEHPYHEQHCAEVERSNEILNAQRARKAEVFGEEKP